jgi:hypothetical protein
MLELLKQVCYQLDNEGDEKLSFNPEYIAVVESKNKMKIQLFPIVEADESGITDN